MGMEKLVGKMVASDQVACRIVVNTCYVLADRLHGTIGGIADDAMDDHGCSLTLFSGLGTA